MSYKAKTVWTPNPKSMLRERIDVISIALYLGAGVAIRIFTPGERAGKTGQVITARLEEKDLDGRLVLFVRRLQYVHLGERIDSS